MSQFHVGKISVPTLVSLFLLEVPPSSHLQFSSGARMRELPCMWHQPIWVRGKDWRGGEQDKERRKRKGFTKTVFPTLDYRIVHWIIEEFNLGLKKETVRIIIDWSFLIYKILNLWFLCEFIDFLYVSYINKLKIAMSTLSTHGWELGVRQRMSLAQAGPHQHCALQVPVAVEDAIHRGIHGIHHFGKQREAMHRLHRDQCIRQCIGTNA